MSIFKKYDIRGICPDEINEEIVYLIGRAIVDFLQVKEIVVGHDMRDSSTILLKALQKGINDQGANVTCIGLCSTPMFYFAARNKPAGVMITASHNPSQYNGMKMCRENSIPISGDTGIMEIKKLVDKNKFPDVDGKGEVNEIDIKSEFIAHNLKHAEGIEGLNIVFDFGNAMGGYEFPLLYDKIDCEKTYLYQELDGNFPNHEANPLKYETLKDLSKKVLEKKASIGIATDGDNDRIGFVDEKGALIPGDAITALIADKILEGKSNEKIIYEVKSTHVIKEVASKHNCKAIVWKTGHAFIKEKMRKENAIFAGEKSGHYYFRENFFCESTLMASFEVLKMMKETGKPISEIIKPYMKYANSGEINFEVKDKDGTLKRIEEHYKDAKISYLDGVTVEYSDWWLNFRKSNTEPLLRLNLEAPTEEKVEEELRVIKGIVSNFQ